MKKVLKEGEDALVILINVKRDNNSVSQVKICKPTMKCFMWKYKRIVQTLTNCFLIDNFDVHKIFGRPYFKRPKLSND